MAGSRTLKLTILGDVADLSKSLTTANKDVDSFGDKVGKVGAVVGAAFVAAAAAAGAYAVKIGTEAVTAAIADEKAQTQLATAITAATGATNAQIAAVEQQILKTSLATGVADDQLRPALGRLVLATNSTKDAQALLNTALDVSAATGKPLETVTNALAKAYEGNTTALGKLGVGYGAAELKGKDFNTIVGELNTQFSGAAATAAGTYQGQIDKLKVGFDEAKESLGVALLPVIQTFITFLSETALPAVLKVVGAFTDKESGLNQGITTVVDTLEKVAKPVWEGFVTAFGFIKTAIAGNKTEFQSFAEVIKTVAPVLGTVLGGVIKVIGGVASVVLDLIGKVAGAIAPILNTAIDGINIVIRGLNLIKPGTDIPTLGKIGATVGTPGFSGTTPGGQSFAGTLVVPKVDTSGVITGGSTKITGGTTGSGGGGGGGVVTASKVAATAAEAASNIVTGSFNAGSFRAAEAASMPTTINLTVNGAIDSEGTARTIVETLNDSYYRGTNGAGSLQIA
jgi:phage-related protein